MLALMLLLLGCERSRTVSDRVIEGPLDNEAASGFADFSKWPAFPPSKSDALRVFVEPSFGRYAYLIDFRPREANCAFRDLVDRRPYFTGVFEDLFDSSEKEPQDCNLVDASGMRVEMAGPTQGKSRRSHSLFREVSFRGYFLN